MSDFLGCLVCQKKGKLSKAFARGLCSNDFRLARKEIKAGRITEEEMIARGDMAENKSKQGRWKFHYHQYHQANQGGNRRA